MCIADLFTGGTVFLTIGFLGALDQTTIGGQVSEARDSACTGHGPGQKESLDQHRDQPASTR